MRQGQAARGYEVMHQTHTTFSIVSCMEAIAVRDEALRLSAKASAYKRPSDVLLLEDQLGQVDQQLHRFPELKPGVSNRLTILLQFDNPECRRRTVESAGTSDLCRTSWRQWLWDSSLCSGIKASS